MKNTISIVIISIVVLSALGTVASPVQRNATTSTSSTDWAGYVVETNLNTPQNNAVTDVKGDWIVPAVSGPVTPNTYSACWIGIDGFSSTTVEQIGTDSSVINGAALYRAWYEMFPKPPVYLTMTIHPGDTMSAEVNYLGLNMFRLSITDVTTGESFSIVKSDVAAEISSISVISSGIPSILVGDSRPLTVTELPAIAISYTSFHTVGYKPLASPANPEMESLAAPRRSSAEWIVEAPSDINGVLPLADFGTVFFSNAEVTVNGVTGSINNGHWQNDVIIMEKPSPPIIKAQPSPLSADGTSFSVTWQHQ